jgi:hypothetical protein
MCSIDFARISAMFAVLRVRLHLHIYLRIGVKFGERFGAKGEQQFNLRPTFSEMCLHTVVLCQ